VPQPTTLLCAAFLNLPVLIYKRNLASSKARVGKEFSIEARRIRRELVLYINDTKKWGHKAFLRKMF
jgi:hypothetical protein